MSQEKLGATILIGYVTLIGYAAAWIYKYE